MVDWRLKTEYAANSLIKIKLSVKTFLMKPCESDFMLRFQIAIQIEIPVFK